MTAKVPVGLDTKRMSAMQESLSKDSANANFANDLAKVIKKDSMT